MDLLEIMMRLNLIFSINWKRKKNDSIYDGIRYLISIKSSITYIVSHDYATIKVDLFDSLPLEKTMTLR